MVGKSDVRCRPSESYRVMLAVDDDDGEGVGTNDGQPLVRRQMCLYAVAGCLYD